MDRKNIWIEHSGIQCDNPSCDYKDDSVKREDYVNWLNKPCPLCGENLLTEEDIKTVEKMEEIAESLNSILPPVKEGEKIISLEIKTRKDKE